MREISGEKVGEGAAGEVFLCEDTKANNAKVRKKEKESAVFNELCFV